MEELLAHREAERKENGALTQDDMPDSATSSAITLTSPTSLEKASSRNRGGAGKSSGGGQSPPNYMKPTKSSAGALQHSGQWNYPPVDFPTGGDDGSETTRTAVSIAESDLDTHRPIPRYSSGIQTRSVLFAARKAKVVVVQHHATASE